MSTDADLPALPEPVAWRYRYHSAGEWKVATEPALQVAADLLPKFEQEPLYTQAAIDAAVAEARAVPEGWKLLKDTTHAERSWPEDSSHENGNYSNTCVHCLRGFVGHKRRPSCKMCAATPSPAEQPATDKESLTVETVPWPQVTCYSGGASHEGIGGRVWIRLADDGPEIEYVPAEQPKPAVREALAKVVSTYDAYRRRGVSPAPAEYADVVAAIEAARAALQGEPHDRP